MKIFYLLLMISFGLITSQGCAPKNDGKQNLPASVNVTELNNVFSEKPTATYLIDVRTDSEWSTGHAAPALHLPMDQVSEETLKQRSINKSDTIYVICASGGRSSKVAASLRSQGFSTVINVEGGTNAWMAAKLPLGKE